jgi:thiamine pyrophosphate-dependent acetolactate synthase large subunit-like protein
VDRPAVTAVPGHRTGGEALVDSLIAHGVDTVFGLPGAQTYGLFDALYQAHSQVRTVGARHEQACSYMAFGYARSTGRPAVCTVVPGPGILNAGAGLLTAWGANQPVLCLTGQVPTSFLDLGRGHLHEMADQIGTVAGFTYKPVVALCGDGGFMFAVQELAIAVPYGIGVVTLVFNNNAFGNVRRDQRERFEGRVLGSDLRGAPWLIEVPVPRDSESDPWRFLQPRAPT